jgi:amino acid adenylation domain-containing protein
MTNEAKDDFEALKTCVMRIECSPEESGLLLRISFDKVMSHDHVRRITHQLEQAIRQLCAEKPGSMKLAEVETLDEQDMKDIWEWNAIFPEPVNMCVHQLIEEHIRQRPNASAVCGWDGKQTNRELTYAELDEQSTRLAYYLVKLGVGPEVLVPLCFEKSIWTVVAMLGVMKAGGASVAMDSSQPEERLRSIINQVNSKLILSSTANKALARNLTKDMVVVVDHTQSWQTDTSKAKLPLPSSSNTLYVSFTSGSTGIPKGAIVTHSKFCSSVRYQGYALGFTNESRVFDFASYSFDVAWSNALQTLCGGGCICVPSDEDRKNGIAESMERLQVNFANLRPSVVRLLNPADVPSLRTLAFSGEAPTRSEISKWVRTVRTINTYGPTECTLKSTLAVMDPSSTSTAAPSIGRGVGANTWIVDAANSNKLVAVGAIGELMLEGPMVGQGYLWDPEKTKASFVDDPPWLLRGGRSGQPGRRGRLYKTGDLVRYNSDGTLLFINRKDGQVKIRGQRVELGEVEHHVRQCLSNIANGVAAPVADVIAEMITPLGGSSPMLVVFMRVNASGNSNGMVQKALPSHLVSELSEKLGVLLPAYMIPSKYIPVAEFPMTASGKTNRRELRNIGSAMMMEQLADLKIAARGPRRKPVTATEQELQALWANVLGMEMDSISANDSFLQLGGDSIGAMQLVGMARRQGLSFSVADIFRKPQLSELANVIVAGPGSDDIVAPFSLLGETIDKEKLCIEVASGCNTQPELIEDVFPCTSLQEGLLALAEKRTGDYIARNVFELPLGVNTAKFKKVWELVVAKVDILRTRIVETQQHGLVQVVLNTGSKWRFGDNLDAYLATDAKEAMRLGTTLSKWALITNSSRSRPCFV